MLSQSGPMYEPSRDGPVNTEPFKGSSPPPRHHRNQRMETGEDSVDVFTRSGSLPPGVVLNRVPPGVEE